MDAVRFARAAKRDVRSSDQLSKVCADRIPPDLEGGIARGTMAGGSQAAAELEGVVDLAVGREEALRIAGGLEPLHLPLSSSWRLVRHLNLVVEMSTHPPGAPWVLT